MRNVIFAFVFTFVSCGDTEIKPDTETTAFDTSLFIPIVDSNISRIPALVEDVDTLNTVPILRHK